MNIFVVHTEVLCVAMTQWIMSSILFEVYVSCNCLSLDVLVTLYYVRSAVDSSFDLFTSTPMYL
jgi:hypothetical protein